MSGDHSPFARRHTGRAPFTRSRLVDCSIHFAVLRNYFYSSNRWRISSSEGGGQAIRIGKSNVGAYSRGLDEAGATAPAPCDPWHLPDLPPPAKRVHMGPYPPGASPLGKTWEHAQTLQCARTSLIQSPISTQLRLSSFYCLCWNGWNKLEGATGPWQLGNWRGRIGGWHGNEHVDSACMDLPLCGRLPTLFSAASRSLKSPYVVCARSMPVGLLVLLECIPRTAAATAIVPLSEPRSGREFPHKTLFHSFGAWSIFSLVPVRTAPLYFKSFGD
ncbi:hypothetical protein DFP72DRAFT_841203 [Ephemerocybe angulata]|uniref:Uncharacterized protein n=1 Tax=Ephemerocybe angulata TaxID=980116 RepID=A0A8H6IDF7_9AGAR|nr:hypothetical protein DFP72DRAFT_841203 [Tulosesus angulatus]